MRSHFVTAYKKKRPADAGLFAKMSRFTGNQLAFTSDIGFNVFPDMVSEGLDKSKTVIRSWLTCDSFFNLLVCVLYTILFTPHANLPAAVNQSLAKVPMQESDPLAGIVSRNGMAAAAEPPEWPPQTALKPPTPAWDAA